MSITWRTTIHPDQPSRDTCKSRISPGTRSLTLQRGLTARKSPPPDRGVRKGSFYNKKRKKRPFLNNNAWTVASGLSPVDCR
jgi:hypothetical protein